MKMSRREVLVAGAAAAIAVVAGMQSVANAQAQSGSASTQNPVKLKQHFDILIVGGGSAGAVLAARLSADARRRVPLLEAGPNFTPDAYPQVLKDANIVADSPAFDWHYHTEDAARLGHDIPVPRGRVIGGSSAGNGTVGLRARPGGFGRWAAAGIEGWPWDEVLAAFKALENTPTGDDAWHGRRGPFPI